MFMIIVAKPGSGRDNRIYRGNDLARMLKRIRTENGIAERKTVGWNPAMDADLVRHYSAMPKDALAEMLSERFRRRVTKNAVISRWNAIKNATK